MMSGLARAVRDAIGCGYADAAAILARRLWREGARRLARQEARRQAEASPPGVAELFAYQPVVHRDGKAFVGRFNGRRYVFTEAR